MGEIVTTNIVQMDPVTKKVLTAAVKKWGEDAQLFQALEELAELMKAILKLYRGGSWEDVLEEVADVEIMIDQLKIIAGTQNEQYRLRKLARLWEKLRTDEWVPFEEIQICQATRILKEVAEE